MIALHHKHSRTARLAAGFTLVELLVVIAIIGILVALLLPAIQSAREAARRTQCQNNMKQLGLATLNYESTKKVLPPSKFRKTIAVSGGRPRTIEHSIMSYFLTFIEETAIASQWDFDQTWNHSDPSLPIDNARLSQKPVAAFRCPTAPQDRSTTNTAGEGFLNEAAIDYRVCDELATGTTSALYDFTHRSPPLVRERPNARGRYESMLSNELVTHPDGRLETKYTKLSKVTDGTSHTFMWFETGGAPVYFKDGAQVVGNRPNTAGTGETQGGETWANYDNFYHVHNFCGSEAMFNCNNNEEIYSFHLGGAFFVMGDGAVRFVQDNIAAEAFVSLFTRDGGDIIDSTTL